MKNNERLVSPYKNNCTAKKSKVFFTDLLNYFFVFVLSFIFTVAVANPIATSLPVSKQINTTISETSLELAKIVGKTRIQEYSEEAKSLISMDYTKKEYLTALCKTSLYLNHEKYNGQDVKVEETFISTNYIYDNLSYYYQEVKLNKTDFNDLSSYNYDGVDYSSSETLRLQFQYEKIMDYLNSVFDGYFIGEEEYQNLPSEYQVGSRFKILSLEYAKYLRTYLIFATTGGIEETTFSYLSSAYYTAVEYGKNEIEKDLVEYVNKNAIVSECVKQFTIVYIVSNTLAFSLVFAILYLLIPLLLKRNKYENVGHLILKLGLSSKEELEPSLGQYLVFCFSKYLISYSTIILSFTFTGIIKLSGINFGSFSFFGLLFACLMYGIVDILFIFINKNHQDFALFTANLVLKDKNDFEGIEEEVLDANNPERPS